jgi:hypothetical protein
MRLQPHGGVRPGQLWLAVAATQTQVQIKALSFGSVIDHMEPRDVAGVLLPAISEGQADRVEAAWAGFTSAQQHASAAVITLEEACNPA